MELIGLLPGLYDAAQRSVARLNEVRAAAHMPPIQLLSPNGSGKRRGRPPGSKNMQPAEAEPEPAVEPPLEKRNRLSRKGRVAASLSASRRWQIMREAGYHPKTLPSAALVARALKKIERTNALA